MHWLWLIIAVVANVVTNVGLKMVAMRIDNAHARPELRGLITEPWLWTAFVAAGALVVAYILALRNLQLEVAYATVTSLALVGVSAASFVMFDERIAVLKIVGIALVIAGIVAMASSADTAV